MKKEGLFKLIFLVAFFVIFITVSVIGSFGLFKFDGSGDPDSPKIFSADFVETDDGYVFNLVSGRAAYYTRLGAVGVRFNKGEVGAENIIYKHYSSVEKTESGYVASAVVSGDKGSQIKVSDYYAIGDSAIGITRKIEVLAVGEEKGFTTEYPILTQKQEKISDSDWFNPAEFYVSGTHGFITTNARTILSISTKKRLFLLQTLPLSF